MVSRSAEEVSRLGLVVSKRVGRRAHDRNRIKRLIREFFRLYREYLDPPADVVVVAKQGAGDLDFREVSEELRSALDKWSAASQ